ncbi:zinc-finger transcription factor of the Zn(2)-Cys(6) binuclear cluster domain type [Scheffersomyces xylosifermentans]|uniref:zinc-finger transcription factor of the Zn(2)-Cys(6) binuclear cluster domain type n=1 Tax=Scheffersomyces xylosifermentans TaxID=1304137 RepID=UPI00315D1E01
MLVTFNSRSKKNPDSDKSSSTANKKFNHGTSSSSSSPQNGQLPNTDKHRVSKPKGISNSLVAKQKVQYGSQFHTQVLSSASGTPESSTVQVIKNTKDFYSFRNSRRSRNGCLTCKIRKKKCDEAKPSCSDCARLHKPCIWVDYDNMSEEEIRVLKERVEQEESNSKLRKRKSKSSSSIKEEDSTGTRIHERGISITKATESRSPLIQPESPPQSLRDSSPPPLDLDTYKSPVSPSAFLNFLKELSQYQQDNNGDRSKIALLEDSEDGSDQVVHEPQSNHSTNTETEEIRDLLTSPSLSAVLDFMKPEVANMFLRSDQRSNYDPISPMNYNSLISNFLVASPSAGPTLIPELANSASGSYLYNYYVDVISKKVSIAPVSQNDSNSYQKVFLPLAHKDKGVLYALLAWSGFYLGGQWGEEGVKYANLALDHLNKSLQNTQNNKDMGSSRNDDRQSVLNKLATLLILCGAEICKGDVKNWSVYLGWGWKILRSNGGILNFNRSKEEHWLISNFAYHDLLASSSTERGTYFPSKDYDTIFKDPEGFSKGNLNPLLGVSKDLYRIIGEISTLMYESKKILHSYYSRDSPTSASNENSIVSESPIEISGAYDDNDGNESEISDHGRISRLLHTVIHKSKNLEREIDEARPVPEDLVGMTDEELEFQLTLFEAFQLSAKLFLKQSIMKCNPSMLESQVLNNDLIKCIDILLDTPVQASLVFPIFMAGIHCVTNHDRDIMRSRLNNFMKLYGPWNVGRAQFIIEKVWAGNPSGNNVVDWHSILRELGWDINFA